MSNSIVACSIVCTHDFFVLQFRSGCAPCAVVVFSSRVILFLCVFVRSVFFFAHFAPLHGGPSIITHSPEQSLVSGCSLNERKKKQLDCQSVHDISTFSL